MENNEIIKALLSDEGNRSSTDPRVHARTGPPVSETLGALTAMEISAHQGNAMHLRHLSLGRSADLVEWYRDQGVDISFETCPPLSVPGGPTGAARRTGGRDAGVTVRLQAGWPPQPRRPVPHTHREEPGMDSSALLLDGWTRIREEVLDVLDGLSAEDLNTRLDSGANSIGWLVWHLTRVQDDHVAESAGREQVWTDEAFDERFGLDLPAGDTGYGHSARDVAGVRLTDPSLLAAYYDAVHEQTEEFLRGLDNDALDRVVDDSWTPPVTLGVRLVSVLAEDLQHVGQAAYIRGILARRSSGR